MDNKDNIHIWSDKWLPSPSSYRVISLVHILNGNAKVSELFDKEKREWITQFIRQVFCPQAVDLVLSILLSLRLPPDKSI